MSSNSPFGRPPTTRALGRTARPTHDLDSWELSLRRIVGSTVSSPTAFDSLPVARSFAYTSGGVAILSTLHEDLRVSQRFFRARPSATAFSPPAASLHALNWTGPISEARKHSSTPVRDAGALALSANPSIGGDWEDSPTSKTWSARERVKAASCLSLSPDGRYLAVGETGYHPRVLIFSTATDASCDTPCAILTEHSHGVSAVAFSPDSRFLASLGNVQDGFLHIWSLNSKSGSVKLVSSNKCISFVCALTWTSKDTLVTAGTRHVKIWRIHEHRSISPSKQRLAADAKTQPSPASPSVSNPLPGRNCLLGSLVDSTFTCVVRSMDDRAIVCSEKGDICLIEENEGNQRLVKIEEAGFGITSIATDPESKYVWLGGLGGIKVISVNGGISPTTSRAPSVSSSRSSMSSYHADFGHITSMCLVGNHLLTLDSTQTIKILGIVETDGFPRLGSPIVELAAHKESVLGVSILEQPLDSGATFFTWTTSGQISFWDLLGNKVDEVCIEVDQLPTIEKTPNELKVVRVSPAAEFFLCGDRLGVLKVFDGVSPKCVYEIKAHGGEIMDIQIYQNQGITIAATCARDRTVQLFRKMEEAWSLVQTFDEHKASVSGTLFLDNGNYLLSCSGDRTVVIRGLVSRSVAGESDKALAYVPIRTLTLKSAAISMATSFDKADSLFVSATGRSVHEFEISSGRQIRSFRASDPDGSDAVIMDKLIPCVKKIGSDSFLILMGVSSTDKSIRIYDQHGSLICREWGHTEGITGLAILDSHGEGSNESDKATIISTGADGTMILWDFGPEMQGLHSNSISEGTVNGDTPTQNRVVTAAKLPVRRVFSKAALAQFKRPSPSNTEEDINTTPTPSMRCSPPRTLRKKPSNFILSSAKCKGSRGASSTLIEEPLSSGGSKSNTYPRARATSSSSTSTSATNNKSNNRSDANAATQNLCRSLRTYRTHLQSSPSTGAVNVIELETELDLTLKAVRERMEQRTDKESDAKSERELTVLNLLEEYSERLIGIVDEKMRIGGLTSTIGSGSERRKERSFQGQETETEEDHNGRKDA